LLKAPLACFLFGNCKKTFLFSTPEKRNGCLHSPFGATEHYSKQVKGLSERVLFEKKMEGNAVAFYGACISKQFRLLKQT